MQIKRTTNLSDTEKQQLTGWGEDVFDSEALNLIWRPKEVHLVLYVASVPVSTCGLIRQQVSVGDQASFWVGGIGGVITQPTYQGKGYARALLNEALAQFTRERYQAALLFCRAALVPYYQNQGWIVVADPVFVLQAGGKVQFPAATMVYPLNQTSWPTGAVHIDSPPW